MSKENRNPINDDVVEERDLDLTGFEYVTKGYFPHTYDPALNIRTDRIYFNAAMIKKLPEVFYVQILINDNTKTIIIKPCGPDDKDAIRWASVHQKTGNKQNREIKSAFFSAKIYELMKWNPDFRYKIAATLIKCRGESCFVIDLNEAEATSLSTVNGRKVYYPEKWRDSFGTPYSEHDKYLSIQLLDGYARIEILNKRTKKITPPKLDNPDQLSLLDMEDNKNGDS